jgi:hypothetical protein
VNSQCGSRAIKNIWPYPPGNGPKSSNFSLSAGATGALLFDPCPTVFSDGIDSGVVRETLFFLEDSLLIF